MQDQKTALEEGTMTSRTILRNAAEDEIVAIAGTVVRIVRKAEPETDTHDQPPEYARFLSAINRLTTAVDARALL
jgi:hypothetical protein